MLRTLYVARYGKKSGNRFAQLREEVLGLVRDEDYTVSELKKACPKGMKMFDVCRRVAGSFDEVPTSIPGAPFARRTKVIFLAADWQPQRDVVLAELDGVGQVYAGFKPGTLSPDPACWGMGMFLADAVPWFKHPISMLGRHGLSSHVPSSVDITELSWQPVVLSDVLREPERLMEKKADRWDDWLDKLTEGA